MKFGLRCSEGANAYGDARSQAAMAEELGFDSVWLAEHHGFDSYWPSPQLALAALAERTTRVRLGTNIVILPLANPVRLAGELALLDQIAGGRVILGVATGWSRPEFRAMGVPFERRGDRMDEYITLMRRLWTEHDVSFAGDFYSFEGFTLSPRPVQPGGPPIWVGGRSDRALRRAAVLGDAWVPDGTATVDELAACRERYDAYLVDSGRDPAKVERPTTRHIVLARTHEAAWRRADAYLKDAYRLQLERGYPLVKPTYTDTVHDSIRGRYIVGDPASCIEQIAGLADRAGIDHLMLKFAGRLSPADARAELELFASDVMPAFMAG